MYQQKLCLSTKVHFGIGVEEQIELFHRAGFEGFFTEWDEHILTYRKKADKLGMLYQSVHAPFRNCPALWLRDEKAQDAVQELLNCVKVCAEAGIPILVLHAFNGFGPRGGPSPEGIANFRRVVEKAAALGVKIAFENTEGEEYLAAVMDAFASYENVGFCWDCGHEMCYNTGYDMLSLYGQRLICTHLNDNLGISDFGGQIKPEDDLHLLPFDGIGDWRSITRRLNGCGYEGILTFELNRRSKGGRHGNDKYARIPLEEYIAQCYERACRVAALKLQQT